MATPYEDLIPVAAARELIAAATQESAVLRLASTHQMPTGVESIPVVAVEPDAEWVDPRYGGRKKATTVEWSASNCERGLGDSSRRRLCHCSRRRRGRSVSRTTSGVSASSG